MKNLLVLSLVTIFLYFLNAANVYACRCKNPYVEQNISVKDKVVEEFNNSTAILVGKIVSFRLGESSRLAKIKVEKVWKGKPAKFLTVETGISSSACGYTFVVEKDYLIYAYEKSGSLRTSICTRTQLVSKSSTDIKILDKIKASNRTNQISPK